MLFTLLACEVNKSESKKENISESEAVLLDSSFYAVGLVYHRFSDSRYPSTNTTIKQFTEHINYLLNKEFETYTVSELIKNNNDNNKKVFITVDDGFKSFNQNGWPVLKKYNCKATLFINTQSVGWSDYLNWDEIKELYHQGVEIGAHSHKHSYFLNYPDSIRKREFIKDLEISEQLFKDSLGFVPRIYAYPYGEYDSTMANVLKQRGYQVAFAQNSGVWSHQSHSFAIPRFPMSGSYVNIEQFSSKVNMKPLPIKGSMYFPHMVKAEEIIPFTLKQDSINKYHGFNCFFNNKACSKAFQIFGDTILAKVYMPLNTRRAVFTLTAKDSKNQWYWWSHLCVNPQVK